MRDSVDHYCTVGTVLVPRAGLSIMLYASRMYMYEQSRSLRREAAWCTVTQSSNPRYSVELPFFLLRYFHCNTGCKKNSVILAMPNRQIVREKPTQPFTLRKALIARAHSRIRLRFPDFRGCDAEAARAKWCADKRSTEKITARESEGTSGTTGMQGWT